MLGGSLCCCCSGVDHLSVGDRVGYTTRSVQGGSYADFTVVSAPLVVKLPEGVSTQDAAAVLLQGLTALSQATTAIANDIKQGDQGLYYRMLWLPVSTLHSGYNGQLSGLQGLVQARPPCKLN